MIKINASLKERLRTYYRNTNPSIDEAAKTQVLAFVSEETATRSLRSMSVKLQAVSFWRFLGGQLRFINPLAWLIQIALVAGMLALVSMYREDSSSLIIVMISAVLSVAIAIPSVFKSFECNVAELEASCRQNATQVVLSRLILFGLADILWLSVAIVLVPPLAGSDPFRVFLYATTPFFASCVLCFHISRITYGRCVKPCIVAVSCCVLTMWGVNEIFPCWYADLSTGVWTCALVAAVILAVYEARRLLEQVTSGIAASEAYPLQQ